MANKIILTALLLFGVSELFSQIEIPNTMAPVGASPYGIVEQSHVLGGWHVVADTVARNSIPAQRREEGMVAYAISDQKAYQLRGGTSNAHWSLLEASFDLGGTIDSLYVRGDSAFIREEGAEFYIPIVPADFTPVYDSLSNPALIFDAQDVQLAACEDNRTVYFYVHVLDDSIRTSHDISSLISETGEGWTESSVIEWNGYAVAEYIGVNLTPGAYSPVFEYKGLVTSTVMNVFAGNPDTVMVFDPPGQDSILVTRVCGAVVSIDTIATGGGGSGSTEQADGLTILGDGSGGNPFRVNTDSLRPLSYWYTEKHINNPVITENDISAAEATYYEAYPLASCYWQDTLYGVVKNNGHIFLLYSLDDGENWTEVIGQELIRPAATNWRDFAQEAYAMRRTATDSMYFFLYGVQQTPFATGVGIVKAPHPLSTWTVTGPFLTTSHQSVINLNNFYGVTFNRIVVEDVKIEDGKYWYYVSISTVEVFGGAKDNPRLEKSIGLLALYSSNGIGENLTFEKIIFDTDDLKDLHDGQPVDLIQSASVIRADSRDSTYVLMFTAGRSGGTISDSTSRQRQIYSAIGKTPFTFEILLDSVITTDPLPDVPGDNWEKFRVYAGHWLLDTLNGGFGFKPKLIEGKYRYFYSGHSVAGGAGFGTGYTAIADIPEMPSWKQMIRISPQSEKAFRSYEKLLERVPNFTHREILYGGTTGGFSSSPYFTWNNTNLHLIQNASAISSGSFGNINNYHYRISRTNTPYYGVGLACSTLGGVLMATSNNTVAGNTGILHIQPNGGEIYFGGQQTTGVGIFKLWNTLLVRRDFNQAIFGGSSVFAPFSFYAPIVFQTNSSNTTKPLGVGGYLHNTNPGSGVTSYLGFAIDQAPMWMLGHTRIGVQDSSIFRLAYVANHTTYADVNAISIDPRNNSIGLWVDAPSARLHLPAGTATASTAPLKFTAGTNLITPEAGAVEWDGSRLYVTQTSGPTRKTLAYTDDVGTDSHMGNTDITLTDDRIHVLDGHYWLLQGNLNNIMAEDSTYFGGDGVGQSSMSVSNTTGFFLAGNDASAWMKMDAIDGSVDLTNEYTGYGLMIADDLAAIDDTPDLEIGDVQGSGPKISFDNDTPSITLSGGEVYMNGINPWGGGAVYNIVQNPTTKEIRYDSLQSSAYVSLINGTMDSIASTDHTDLKIIRGWSAGAINSGHWTVTDSSLIYNGSNAIIVKVEINANYWAASAGKASIQIGHAVASGTSQFIVTNGQNARETAAVVPDEGEYHTSSAFQISQGYEVKFKAAGQDGIKILDGGVIIQQLNFMN